MEAVPTPLPHQAPPAADAAAQERHQPDGRGQLRRRREFDPQPAHADGDQAVGLKPVREPQPEDDPYADLNLLPLEVAPDLSGRDEVEEGGTNPTNPFIRGAHASKLAQYTAYGSRKSRSSRTCRPCRGMPGTGAPAAIRWRRRRRRCRRATCSAAVDALREGAGGAGGLAGEVARDHLPLSSRSTAPSSLGADRVRRRGRSAAARIAPRRS